MRVVVFCLLAVVSAVEGCSLPDGGEKNRRAAAEKLQALGYEVTYGYQDFNSTCKSWSPDCFGENPSSPYGTWNIRTPLFLNLSEKAFQMKENDMLVFYGCSPPPARYYSFDLQVFITRERWIFASVGDAQNHLTLNTTGPTPFDTELLVASGGDQVTRNDVFTAFSTVGVKSGVFNTVPIPDNKLLGTDPIKEGIGGSVFLMVLRVAICDSESACTAYRHSEIPIMKVSPKQHRTQQAFPLYPLRVRGTGSNENAYLGALNKLIAAVKTKHGGSQVAVDQANLVGYPLDGRQCIKNLTNCIGATRDAIYNDGDEPLLAVHPNGPSWLLPDDKGTFLMVCGVNHALTKKATYINVAPYDAKREMSTGAVIDKQLEGSSLQYLDPSKVPGANAVYVYMFKRNCEGQKYCYEVPSKGFPSIALDRNVTFVERAYLEKLTKVGPAAAEIITPTILHFKRE